LKSKTVSRIVLALLLTSILSSAFIIQPVKAESRIASRIYSDDFSTDTGMWEYLGFAWPGHWGEGAKYSAYRDTAKNYVVLTRNDYHLAGVIWFDWTFTWPFTVSFRYLAGGGSGADGLVMMFYHEKPPYLWSGASLSFIGSGYGIEFDNHYNYLDDEYGGPPITDPSANHIAIGKDYPSNHLIYVDDQRTEDNVWHSVTVDVDYTSITVFIDSQQVIHWQGTIDRTHGGFGFAGTTGGLTNWHLIDDFSITIWAHALTWTVDDDGPADFHTIQEAINAAIPGDTIYVKAGIYYEDLTVDKSLTLIGEDKSITTIYRSWTERAVSVWADNVVISGFTVQGAGPIECKGIFLSGRRNVTIKNTQIKGFFYGIYLYSSSTNSIVGNDITANIGAGIHLYYYSSDNIISENNIVKNGHGIDLFYHSKHNSITGNNITANRGAGILLYFHSDNNRISGNNITANKLYGVMLGYSSNNIFYHNNIVGNTQQVYFYDPRYVNIWDDGYPSGGNYWSDYEQRYPYANELDGSGIWDTPYVIDDYNRDRYPLMKPWTPVPPPYAAFPFIWPVPSVGKGSLTRDYGERVWSKKYKEYRYHTGIDIVATVPNTPVVAAATGKVVEIVRAETNHTHGMENVVVIEHTLPPGHLSGKTKVYALYAHMVSIRDGLKVGDMVTAGYEIGKIYGTIYRASPYEEGTVTRTHLHFEVKDEPTLGRSWTIIGPAWIKEGWAHLYLHNPRGYPSGSTKMYWGYTPNHPDSYGYHDPILFLHEVRNIDPIIVRVTTDTLIVRRGPSTEYPVQATIYRGQKFVALRISEQTGDNWYQIYRSGSGWDTSDGWVSAKYVEKEPFPGGIVIKSPADLVVTDPDGFAITKELGEAPGMHYIEFDLDRDGEVDDMVVMLERKIGEYLITVIPEPEALPTDAYTLEVWVDDVIIALAENVQISNIPSQPYIVRSTETEIIPIIPATIDFDPDTLNLKSAGQWVTVYMELPVGHGYDVSQIDVSSLKLNDTVSASSEPTQIGDYDGDGITDFMVKFDRATVIQWLGAMDYSQDTGKSYTIKLTITGTVAGVKFKATDTITILKK
jgi:parallel beta-helix repeat protein